MIAILISFEMNATAEMLADIRSIGHIEPVIANFCCGMFCFARIQDRGRGSAFSPCFSRVASLRTSPPYPLPRGQRPLARGGGSCDSDSAFQTRPIAASLIKAFDAGDLLSAKKPATKIPMIRRPGVWRALRRSRSVEDRTVSSPVKAHPGSCNCTRPVVSLDTWSANE